MSELTVTLSDLQPPLPIARWTRRPTNARSKTLRVAFLGRSGEVTQLRRAIGTLPPAERPDRRQSDQRSGRGDGSATCAARQSRLRATRIRSANSRKRSTSRFPSIARRDRLDPPDAARDARCVRVLSRAAVSRSCSVPKSRRTTTTSTRSTSRPTIRRAKASTRSGSPIAAAAPAHVADADSHDAAASSADRHRRARQMLSPRCGRRAPSLSVPSNRRTAGRRRHPLRPSQGHADRHVPRALRAGSERALPPVVLSVHRTERRSRHDLSRSASGAGRHRAACAAARAGSSSAAREWSIPTCLREVGYDPDVVHGLGLRLRHRAPRAGALRDRRHPPLRRERSRLSRATCS